MMLHIDTDNMEPVHKFSGEALEGKSGYIRQDTDQGMDYVMILLPYPKDAAPALIDHLKHGY